MKRGYLLLPLHFLLGYLMIAGQSFGQSDQSPPPFNYSIPVQRLQLKLTTSFVFFSLYGRLDMDSAAILASEGEHIPYSLWYDEDYADGPNNNIKELLKKGSYYLFQSGASPNDLSKALSCLLTAKQEADRSGDPYFRHAARAALGRYYLQSNEQPKSKQSFTEAVDIARKENKPALLFRALANRGTYAGFNDDQKEKDLNESLKLSQQLRDTVGEIEMLTRIYEIYFVQRKFDTVKKQLLHVTDLEKRIGYRHTHYNHRVLAYMALYLNSNWAEAFIESKAAVDIMEAVRDFAFSNYIYAGMAAVYSDFENYDKSLFWLNKCIERESNNTVKRIWYPQFTFVTMNIAKTGGIQTALDFTSKIIREYPPVTMNDKMNIAHQLGFCYFHKNQKELCGKQYAIMEPYLDSLKNDPSEKANIFSAYADLFRYHLALGQVDIGKKYFQKAKAFIDSTDLFNIASAHEMQYKLDSSEGNYLKALNGYRFTRSIYDSIYNLGKAKQLSELQVQYEIEAKDKNIELLVQKDKVQQATLRQSGIIRKVTLAGIVVLLIITGLIYVQYRNKQKSNKEINEKNRELEQLVRDKEWLVKEIHHRVKNNFHIVASLLEIQSSYLKNKEALSAIKESQHRIHSMSIIHQKLYQSETLSTIHMPEYIYELVEYLRESYGIRENIGFSLEIDKVELDHGSAITLGLILNEAITNAIKYAFDETKDGQIAISLTRISDSQLLLNIADNGRGLPANFDSRIGVSMGMELLQGLTDDLGGSFSIETNGGTRIKVIFDYRSLS